MVYPRREEWADLPMGCLSYNGVEVFRLKDTYKLCAVRRWFDGSIFGLIHACRAVCYRVWVLDYRRSAGTDAVKVSRVCRILQ